MGPERPEALSRRGALPGDPAAVLALAQVPCDHRGGRFRCQGSRIADDLIDLLEPGLSSLCPRPGVLRLLPGAVPGLLCIRLRRLDQLQTGLQSPNARRQGLNFVFGPLCRLS